MKSSRGFTLIELMISIGVVAISSTILILVLNPVEILAQARDSQRIADLEQMRRALTIYLASVKDAPLRGL